MQHFFFLQIHHTTCTTCTHAAGSWICLEFSSSWLPMSIIPLMLLLLFTFLLVSSFTTILLPTLKHSNRLTAKGHAYGSPFFGSLRKRCLARYQMNMNGLWGGPDFCARNPSPVKSLCMYHYLAVLPSIVGWELN